MDVVVVEELSSGQEKAVFNLQKLTFVGVTEEEAEEDFYHPNSAHVLANLEDELVGWAGIHETEIEFEGKMIKMGGYGICTLPDWQRSGIASRESQAALDFLKYRGG